MKVKEISVEEKTSREMNLEYLREMEKQKGSTKPLSSEQKAMVLEIIHQVNLRDQLLTVMGVPSSKRLSMLYRQATFTLERDKKILKNRKKSAAPAVSPKL